MIQRRQIGQSEIECLGVRLIWGHKFDVDAGDVVPDELWVVASHDREQICRLDRVATWESEQAVRMEYL